MTKLLLVAIALMFTTAMVHAETAPGRAQTCVACHGKDGVSVNPLWPNLAGQKAGYLAAQLTAFRDGVRENPAMAPFVKGLSDAEIQALASYYAAKPISVSANGDASQVAAGEHLSAYCKACHGMKGIPVAQVWPNLAGQHAAYLQAQLKAYKSGSRQHPHMQTVLIPLDDAQFAALAAYYSQLKP
jgi:cytochrome c553